MPNLITIPATARYESQARGGLTAKTIYEINEYGHGVLVGGGNLYENNELDVDLSALKALNVPLFLFSISRGRIYNRSRELVERTDVMPDEKLKIINEKAFLTLARDQATCDHIRKIGVSKVKTGACPTMFLNRVMDHLPPVSEDEKGLTLISVRNPDVMNIPLNLKPKIYNEVANLVYFFKKEGHRVKLLCHDHRDIAFVSCISDADYIYTDDVNYYLSLLKHCRLNVAYRLHSAIPCLSFGTPVINISYDERANNLFETIGYKDWSVNTVLEEDVCSAVAEKYRKISELESFRKSNFSLWTTYYNQMIQAFGDFAKEAQKRAEEFK